MSSGTLDAQVEFGAFQKLGDPMGKSSHINLFVNIFALVIQLISSGWASNRELKKIGFLIKWKSLSEFLLFESKAPVMGSAPTYHKIPFLKNLLVNGMGLFFGKIFIVIEKQRNIIKKA